MALPDRLNDLGVRGDKSHANAGLREIDYRQPNEQRSRGGDLEIDECFHTHPPYFSQRACASDSDDDSREHQRCDDGFDQVDKDVAQKIDCVPPIGPEPPDQTAGNESDHNLHCQRGAIPRPARLLRNRRSHRDRH